MNSKRYSAEDILKTVNERHNLQRINNYLIEVMQIFQKHSKDIQMTFIPVGREDNSLSVDVISIHRHHHPHLHHRDKDHLMLR